MYENASSHNQTLAPPSRNGDSPIRMFYFLESEVQGWPGFVQLPRTAPQAPGFLFPEPSCHVQDSNLGHSSFSALSCFGFPNRRQRLTFYSSPTASMAKGGLARWKFCTEFLTECSISVSPLQTFLNLAHVFDSSIREGDAWWKLL